MDSSCDGQKDLWFARDEAHAVIVLDLMLETGRQYMN